MGKKIAPFARRLLPRGLATVKYVIVVAGMAGIISLAMVEKLNLRSV